MSGEYGHTGHSVLDEVAEERARQQGVHGWSEARDDANGLPTWSYLLASRAVQLGHPWPEAAGVDARRLLIEISAIAVAAIQSLDRKALQTGTGD